MGTEVTVVAIVLGLALVAGIVIWAFRRGDKSGEARAENRAHEDAADRRREADEIMSESVADEEDWLAPAHEQLAELQDEQSDP